MPTAAFLTEGVNPYFDHSEVIIQFWRETIQPSEFVLDIIENGYKNTVQGNVFTLQV